MSVPNKLYVTADEYRQLWAGWSVAVGPKGVRARSPKGELLGQMAFRALFAGKLYQMDTDGDCTENAWQAFVFNRIHHFPRVDWNGRNPTWVSGID